MPESWSSRLLRWRFNWFPAYRGTGARITYIADDGLEVRVRLPLSWRTRNYVGTLYGGSMYGAVDPIWMVMLIRALGPGFVVWDKAATIQFLQPGRSALRTTFRLDPGTVAEIADAARREGRLTRDFESVLVDEEGEICFRCTKTVYVRWKGPAAGTTGSA
jgi:acyl-coenzyme A thioesterase PaaI-like protein